MRRPISILDSCQPRSDILTADFNPEVFTPDLAEVIRFYRGEKTGTSDIYTNSEKFFTDATYPTRGLLNLFRNVLRRVTAGDGTAPGTTRLESGFGGGKTHGLIGIVHLIKRGTKLKHFVSFIEPDLLPSPDTIKVAGIVGTELDLHKRVRRAMKPHTLWGEIALQLGGHQLYEELEADVLSFSAPGKRYFDRVFANHPCVVLIDELAQYATRLKFEYPGAEQQLTAFLLALMGYAATHKNMSVVITLAGSEETFGTETERLRRAIENDAGITVHPDQLNQEITELAKDLRSVSARQEQAITPVTPDELPRIMAKRLFENIDYIAAEEVACEYEEMYLRNSEVPAIAKDRRYRNIIEKHYPFHPTLIDLLDRKLSTIPTFQRTRGLLRVLTLTLRNIWKKQLNLPLIHSCHIDMYDNKTVDELFGRTNACEFKAVLDTDIGSLAPESKKSRPARAQQLDMETPHPLGYPVHEWSWKVVLLHSLVGNSGEHAKSLFGISMEEAVLEISFPGLEPPLVVEALQSLENHALYLKKDPASGKYFASLELTVNKVLAEAEKEITEDQINCHIAEKTKNIISEFDGFEIISGIRGPEEIHDTEDKPTLCIIDIGLRNTDLKNFFTSAGEKPATHQNLLFLLVPRTIVSDNSATKHVNYLKKVIRSHLACKKILAMPEHFGLKKDSKAHQEMEKICRERASATKKVIFSLYDSICYAGENGKLVRKKISNANFVDESGLKNEIRKILAENGRLLTDQFAKTSKAVHMMANLFFKHQEDISVKRIKKLFSSQPGWPICTNLESLDTLLKTGTRKGVWGLYRQQMFGIIPTVFISTGKCRLPFPENQRVPDDWRVIKAETVVKRGWLPVGISYRTGIPHNLDFERFEKQPYSLTLDDTETVLKLLSRLYSYFKRGAKSSVVRIVLENLPIEGGGKLNLCLENIDLKQVPEISRFFKMISKKVTVGKETKAVIEIENPGVKCILADAMKKAGATEAAPH